MTDEQQIAALQSEIRRAAVDLDGMLYRFIAAAIGTVVVLSVGGQLVPVAAALRRALFLVRFRRRLQSLPAEERAAVLLPLRADPSAGQLAAHLLRKVTIPNEM